MSQTGEQVLLRIYLQSADRAPRTPTYERIVKAARQRHLAGATVLKGLLGVGYHGVIKRSAWSMVEHVPVIVEIVDSGPAMSGFIHDLFENLMIGGMATVERAAVMMVRAGRGEGQGASSDASPLTSCPLPLPLKPLSTLPEIQQSPHMTINENGILLRVFIGESDRLQHKPLFEAIVQKVRELGLAGATVLRGVEGFGAHSVVHKSSLLEMSADLPLVIEIVDTEEKIKLLLPHVEKMVTEGMVTMEYVKILLYRHGAEERGNEVAPKS